ncbi:MAG: hypothetical protein RR275_06310 [Lachnospiraceae bacterium]
MENAKKRLRVCLICIVFLAIIVGLFYYYYDEKQAEMAGEGTLITITDARTGESWPV